MPGMSSDDFGTVNQKHAERAREIEIMRQRYRRHREALTDMAADAPTEYLAGEYRRLIHEVEMSLNKLDELEGKVTLTPPAAPLPSRTPTEPGRRPLAPPPAAIPIDDEPSSPRSRLALIVVAALLVLGALGWLIWRASSDERPITPIVEEPADSTGTVAPAAPADTPETSSLAVEPPTHDYGVVRKGTRAARQFEIVNATDAPVSVKVERSTCRCLYYDYADTIPAKGRETLTVTVDGAKAEAGQLQEAIAITSSADSAVTTTFNVTATIR